VTTPEDPNQQQPVDPFAAPQPGATPPSPDMPPPPPPQYGAPPPQYGTPPPQYGTPPPYQGAPPAYQGGPGYGQMQATGPMYGGNALAHWGWRVLGAIVDGLIFGIPILIIQIVTGSRVLGDILNIIVFIALGYLNGAQGQTPGKRIVGIKVLREQDGQLLGGGMGIVRAITHILDTISCLIGYLWPLWDAKRQTFADKLLGSVVIKL
jgi:uncharacterized RDD family membrane protein YckC